MSQRAPGLRHMAGVHMPLRQSLPVQQSVLAVQVSPTLRHWHMPLMQSELPQQSSWPLHAEPGPRQQVREPPGCVPHV